MYLTTYRRLPESIRRESLELRRALQIAKAAGGTVDSDAFQIRRAQLRDKIRRLNERRAA